MTTTRNSTKKSTKKAAKRSAKPVRKAKTRARKKPGPAADRGELRARILDAADELLGEVGYAGAAIGDIAKRAEVNKALVFYYFGSKRALFDHVLERYYEQHRDALADVVDMSLAPRARVKRVIHAYLDYMEANRRYPRLVQQLVSGGEDQVALIQRNLAPLYRLITGMLADVAAPDGPRSARHFFVTFSAVVINYFTYAPVMDALWGTDPLGAEALAERRAHVDWLVEIALADLERRSAMAPPRAPTS